MNDLSTFFEMWPFFRAAALSGAIAGAVLGWLGVWVIARRMVFFTAALAQASGFGTVVTLALANRFAAGAAVAAAGMSHAHDATKEWVTALGAFAVAMGTALALTSRISRRPGARDELLALVYVGATAATLVVGAHIPQTDIPNVTLWLFSGRGDAGILPDGDLWRVAIIGGLVMLVQLVGWRGFSEATLDPDAARVRGLPVRAIDVTLLASLALAASVFTWILGVLPVFAYSTLPAIGALRLAPNLRTALPVAAVLGGASGFVGYVGAFVLGTSVGATQALVATALAGAAWLAGAVIRR